MHNLLNTAYRRGLQGESVALAFLKQSGYDILRQRYKTPYGEIDVVAQLGQMIVCVEVKTRRTLSASLHAVQHKQQERIMNAYLYFIQSCPQYADYSVRFDVIVCAPNTKPIHLQHAFESTYE